ncbi:hypothetical protein PMIN06_012105 [Paraphaeosphaeria minitans]
MDIQDDASGGAEEGSEDEPRVSPEGEGRRLLNGGKQESGGNIEDKDGIAHDYTYEAAQVPLSPSSASSVNPPSDLTEAPLPSGPSRQNKNLLQEEASLPPRKKVNPFLTWVIGNAISKNRKRRKQEVTAPLSVPDEVKNYRHNIDRLSNYLHCFDNVATTRIRHNWSSKIVLYDPIQVNRINAPGD